MPVLQGNGVVMFDLRSLFRGFCPLYNIYIELIIFAVAIWPVTGQGFQKVSVR